MGKRQWPNHPAVGLTANIRGVPHLIVDAKPGPQMVDTSKFDQPDADIIGTIILRVKPAAGGAEFWISPMAGIELCAWAELQRAIAAAPKLAGEG